jgi:hypothetical protein
MPEAVRGCDGTSGFPAKVPEHGKRDGSGLRAYWPIQRSKNAFAQQLFRRPYVSGGPSSARLRKHSLAPTARNTSRPLASATSGSYMHAISLRFSPRTPQISRRTFRVFCPPKGKCNLKKKAWVVQHPFKT